MLQNPSQITSLSSNDTLRLFVFIQVDISLFVGEWLYTETWTYLVFYENLHHIKFSVLAVLLWLHSHRGRSWGIMPIISRERWKSSFPKWQLSWEYHLPTMPSLMPFCLGRVGGLCYFPPYGFHLCISGDGLITRGDSECLSLGLWH